MKQTQLFTKTQKFTPKDEQSKNAKLLIRAGFIHKEMAGVYSYLPLGFRVLEKIKQIAREEMQKIDSEEIIMSGLQSKQIWQKSNRWDDNVVDVWFKSKLKSGKDIGFGWSHEEPITNMMINHINSYKDLPVSVFQFQTKLRNEERAKSGIMRGREFVMKDMYSYCKNKEELEEYYQRAIIAYNKFYNRVGIGEDTHIVFADGGAFTEFSHEFQTIAEVGEDLIFKVPNKDEYLNQEIVKLKIETKQDKNEINKEMQEIFGKGLIGVGVLAEFLKIDVEKTTKTILFKADDTRIIAVAVRGDRDVDEGKLRKIIRVDDLELLSEESIKELTGAKVGYAGMLNLPNNVEKYWDYSTDGRINFEMGANKTDYHNINVNFGVNIEKPKEFYDITKARDGDIEPLSGEKYKTYKATEVGNIFNFGTEKAKDMELSFVDERGENKPVYLGSYGIGITRVMGVIAEKFADEKGLVWPESIAPFKVHLISISQDKKAEELYKILKDNDIEVLWDNRDKRPGEKFADSDLIGIPYRVVLSNKSMEKGGIELKKRTEADGKIISTYELIELLKKY